MSLPKIYGLVGYPIKHSFSPAMHNAAFHHLKINAEYRLFEKRPEELDGFMRSLLGEGISGLNVTVPFKERVLDFVDLDKESFYLRQVGAVNTLVLKDNSWKGFNTDIPGFSRHIRENIDPKDKKVAILGAGGASRAVCYALAGMGAKSISLYDLDMLKAHSLIAMMSRLYPGFEVHAFSNIQKLDIHNKDLLINATPVGIKRTDPCLVDEDLIHKDLFVYDLLYNPPKTKLINLAQKKGARSQNGLGMLLYQGMLSFKHWTGIDAPEDVMRRALEKELEKCRS